MICEPASGYKRTWLIFSQGRRPDDANDFMLVGELDQLAENVISLAAARALECLATCHHVVRAPAEPSNPMRRFLPILIILAVGLVTAATAAWFYHEKMRPDAPKHAPALATGPATTPSSTIPPDIAAPTDSLPVADSQHARGGADAPVTLEVYGDFQCPSCAKTTEIIADLEKSYGIKLRVVFHEFPLSMHAHALEAAMAAEAAGVQGHFWEMHDALYKGLEQSVEPRPLFRRVCRDDGLESRAISGRPAVGGDQIADHDPGRCGRGAGGAQHADAFHQWEGSEGSLRPGKPAIGDR